MIISVTHLSKHFQLYKKDPGLMGSMKSLIHRKYETVEAVKDVSFSISKGELVGFIGPNGAGKTTTLKCLSGLLYPSGGSVSVLGYTPYQRRPEYLKSIALVMGQKNQLWWDLPAQDSFLLNKEIYEISDQRYKKTLGDLAELLNVGKLLSVQVRKLSLGERMKMELIAALIHAPEVLFLDEPTIGLDVLMQKQMRDFIKTYNKQNNSTIILTSHYMEDVRQLAKRVIVIDHGNILYDGKLESLISKFASSKLLSIVLEKIVDKKKFEAIGTIVQYEYPKVVIKVNRKDVKRAASKLLETIPVDDLNIEEPGIEDVIRDVFTHSL